MTRIRLLALTTATLIGCLMPAVVHAEKRSIGSPLVRTSFRLQPDSLASQHATYWLAYGPVAGKFGLVQMHPNSAGIFVASTRLPLGARGTFYYIQGQGAIHTRAGLAPGNPVHTIGHVGPLRVSRQPVPMFHVASPAG